MKVHPPGHVEISDGSIWPAAGEHGGRAEWALRYGTPSEKDLLYAASVISAYRHLIHCGEKKAALVRREVSRGSKRLDALEKEPA